MPTLRPLSLALAFGVAAALWAPGADAARK